MMIMMMIMMMMPTTTTTIMNRMMRMIKMMMMMILFSAEFNMQPDPYYEPVRLLPSSSSVTVASLCDVTFETGTHDMLVLTGR